MKQKFYTFALLAAFLFAANTISATEDIDNSATAPTVIVPDTIQMLTDVYACYMSHSSAVISDTQWDVTSAGDWFKYKISSVSGGTYNVVLSMATKGEDSKVNVSLYTTDGTLVDTTVTYGTYNNSWTSTIDYKYPINLVAGVEYIIKISLVDAGTNVKALSVSESTQSPDATLSALTVDGVEMDGFDAAVYAYEYAADAGTTQITLGAIANASTAVVADTGTVAVEEGDNSFDIVVTAEDGSQLTYTVNVSVAFSSSTDATLSSLSVDGETLSPTFDADTYEYTVIMNSIGASSATINAEANDPDAQGLTGVDDVVLSEGRNTFEVVVTSQAGTTETYTLYIITPIAVSSGDTLAMLSDIIYVPDDKTPRVSDAQINWFSAGEYVEYYIYSESTQSLFFTVNAANAAEGVSSLNVSTYTYGTEWTIDEANTDTITWNGTTEWGVDYAEDFFFNINLEANTPVVLRVYCVSNANKNSLANIYNFSFEEPFDVSLSAIQVDGVAIEGFDAEILSYDVELANGTTVVPVVTATATDETTTITVTQAGSVVDTATIVVESTTGRQGTYTVNFSVAPLDTTLSTITVDLVEIEGFESTTFSYDVQLPSGSTDVPVVDATATDITATITITQADSVVGTATVFVEADDGGTATYTINFTVEIDTTLSAVTVNGEALADFDPAVQTYNIELATGTTELPVVLATATDVDETTVTVTDVTELPGAATILVAATDGGEATYTINFTVAAIDTTLASITVNGEALDDFDPAVQIYNVALASGTTELPVVLATPTDVDETTVTVTNATEIPGAATILVETTDGGEATYTINFTISTSINTVKTEFELYPNPVSDVLNISSSVEVLKVQIYSITGAEVKSLSGNQTSVNVSDLTSGIYFVSVTTEEGAVIQKITIR
jgi:hypothetical protein